jgi:hypothetical protein
MQKSTYRIIPRKRGTACDVEMTEPGAAPRIVNTFNSEAEAWEWANEQRLAAKFSARLPETPGKKS